MVGELKPKGPKGPTEQFPVSAYVGSSKNLKDLKDCGSRLRSDEVFAYRCWALSKPKGPKVPGPFQTLGLVLEKKQSPPAG